MGHPSSHSSSKLTSTIYFPLDSELPENSPRIPAPSSRVSSLRRSGRTRSLERNSRRKLRTSSRRDSTTQIKKTRSSQLSISSSRNSDSDLLRTIQRFSE